jgi:thiosulfate reductase cytochrome b subunit
MAEKKMIYLHPIPVRAWHWLHALGIVLLVLTGLQIRYPEYVNLFGSYKAAVTIHNWTGIIIAIDFVVWFVYYVFIAGTFKKLYVPTGDDIKFGMLRQALFYFFFYFLGRPNPHVMKPDNKFNPMQKAAYLVIMGVLVPLVIITGLLLMNAVPFRDAIIMFGGIKVVVLVHYLIAACLFAFLFVHVYLATLGHTFLAHFITMFTGWEEEEDHE